MHYFRNNLINIGIVLHLSKTDPPIFKNHNSHFQITSWSHSFWILSSKENFFPFFYEKPKQRKEEQTSLVPERCLRRKLCREETSESAWRKPRACQTMGPDLQIQIWRTKVKVLSARWNISSSGSRLPSKRQEEKKQGIRRCRGRRLGETPHYGCQPPAARPRNSQEVVRSGICLVEYILRVRFLSTEITALPWNIQTFN